ncbi:MAG TPA: FtsQ-type POTRA domain-containing protein [Verrucomicrobiae bacterium]|nr:FtsQ-type POTRA domain-containing protein [Verrucomicrobiae bacterium]
MAKLKSIDIETYPREILVDEEPKYLRRQKPLEIKRRKFGRKVWKTYLQVTMWAAVGVVGAWAVYDFSHFLLTSPETALIHPEQIVLAGNHYVAPASVLGIFAPDRGKSILLIPLDERRRQIEALSWVERATVRRVLPNQIAVEITERIPIAFLREPGDLALIDAHGVILSRPIRGNFHFPVVTGIMAGMPVDSREERMQLFSGFVQQIESVRPDAIDRISEVDLSDGHDLRATLTGFEPTVANTVTPDSQTQMHVDTPVLVHFGDTDFAGKYQTLVEEFNDWRAEAGAIESVDLRFSREAVVNQIPVTLARRQPPKLAATSTRRHSR